MKPDLTTFIRTVFAAFLFAFSCSAQAEEPDEVYLAANTDFESGNFEQAKLKFEGLVEKGLISSELYYNLGTTQYHLGNEGEAMLWMRRAMLAEPDMPDARQNVEFLRTRLGFLEFDDNALNKALRNSPHGTGRWIGTLCLWTGLICLSGAFFSERFKPNRSTLITVGVILAMFSIVGFQLQRYLDRNVDSRNFSTVVAPNAAALTAPSPEAKAVIALPPGSEVRVLQTSGQWCYADIPGDLRGWIKSSQLKANWPVTPLDS